MHHQRCQAKTKNTRPRPRAGVEKITLYDNNNTERTDDDKYYEYKSNENKMINGNLTTVDNAVQTFLTTHGYQDAAYVINETWGAERETLITYFQAGWQDPVG